MYVHGFRFFFTPLAGVLFAFPSRYWFTIGQSGVFSLGGWSPIFRQDTTCPALLFEFTASVLSCTDYHPVPSDFPDRSTNTQADSDSGLLPVRSPLLGESRLISFLGVLRCFSSPVRLVNLCIQLTIVQRIALGFPIRTSPGQGFISPRRRFSQISTSFIASDCQGIHRVRLVA